MPQPAERRIGVVGRATSSQWEILLDMNGVDPGRGAKHTQHAKQDRIEFDSVSGRLIRHFSRTASSSLEDTSSPGRVLEVPICMHRATIGYLFCKSAHVDTYGLHGRMSWIEHEF